LLDRVGSVHAVADARDDVGTERRLAIKGREHRGSHARAQVHQRPDKRRGPDVECDAVAIPSRVTRFDRDEVLAREHSGDAKSRLAKNSGNGAQHGNARHHAVTFVGERVLQARDVAALVLHGWLVELQVDLANVGVEDDQAAEAHGRGLGHAQQLGHLAGHVLVDPRLAGKPPSVRNFGGPQLPVIGGFGIRTAANHPHLAFAARAATAARGVDGQPDPVRGAEDRGAGWHAGGPVERQVGDLELALDHCARPAACSARNLAIHRIAYSSWPSSRSPASTARLTCGSSGLVIAHVSPECIASGRNAALTVARSGRPNDTLEAPHVMLLPSSSRMRRIVSSVMTPHVGSAATVIAIGSMITSSCGMPSSAARSMIRRPRPTRSAGTIEIPVSSFAIPMTAAPCFFTSGRMRSIRSSSAVTELTSAFPSYALSPASSASMIDESMQIGRSVTSITARIAATSRAGSSTAGMPALTSSM